MTYNHERYIESAVRSALAQGPLLSEVIVADDGSSDGTVARTRAIADPRIRLITGPRRGLLDLAATYNAAVSAATSEYVALLEGDDLWPLGKLDMQVAAFEDPRVVVAHGDYAVIGARGTVLRDRVRSGRPPGSYDALAPHLLGSYVMPVTAVIRREALLAAGGFTQLAGTPHWDYPTFHALAERGLFHHAAGVVGIWRKHGGSGTFQIAGTDTAGAELARSLAIATRRRLSHRRDLPSERRIRAAWSDAFARNALQVGRILLVGHRYREARRLAFQGLTRARSLGLRLRLVALLVASLAHADFERVARVRGHSTIEELR